MSLLLHHYKDEEYEDYEEPTYDDDDDDGDDGIDDDVLDYDECSGSSATDELRQEYEDKPIPSNDCDDAASNAVAEGEQHGTCRVVTVTGLIITLFTFTRLVFSVSLFSLSIDLTL